MYRRWAIFFVTSTTFLLSQFYRASNAVIAPHLVQDLSLDTEALGLLSAVFFYAFALTQIPIGILLDRVKPRRTMTVLSLVAVLGALTFAWADSLLTGVLGRVLLGVGMACNLMGTFKLLTIWFGPASFGTLSGITISIGTVGNMAATTPLVLLVQAVGWRWGFTLIAGINLLLAAILFVVVRDRPSERDQLEKSTHYDLTFADIFSGLGELFKKKEYWIISFASFCRYGVFAAFQTLWAGPYLMGVMGLSPLQTGNLILLLNIALIAGGPAWGLVSDRFLRRRRVVVILSLGIFSLVILAFASISSGAHLPVLALLFFCFGFSGGVAGVMFAHIKEHMPLEMAGVAMTGINFFTMFGAAVFLHGLGSFMQHFYPLAPQGPEAFSGAFLLCTASMAFSVFLYAFTRDPIPTKK
jgi:sugar phosphate permease